MLLNALLGFLHTSLQSACERAALIESLVHGGLRPVALCSEGGVQVRRNLDPELQVLEVRDLFQVLRSLLHCVRGLDLDRSARELAHDGLVLLVVRRRDF